MLATCASNKGFMPFDKVMEVMDGNVGQNELKLASLYNVKPRFTKNPVAKKTFSRNVLFWRES